MRNKNVADAGKFDSVFPKLDLGTFPTVDQKHMVFDFQYLGGWIGQSSGSGGITP